MDQNFDAQAAKEACQTVKRCFQVKDALLVSACVQKVLGYFDEEIIAQFVNDIRDNSPQFNDFISSLPPYDETTIRQQLDAELKYFSTLQHLKQLHRRDIDRAGAVFALLYTKFEPQEAATISIEFLAAISILRVDSDGETTFSLKSRGTIQNETVCGANVIGALSPISEASGMQYEALPNITTINSQVTSMQMHQPVQLLTKNFEQLTINSTPTHQMVQPTLSTPTMWSNQPTTNPLPLPNLPQNSEQIPQPAVAKVMPQVPFMSYQNLTPTWQSSIQQQMPFQAQQWPSYQSQAHMQMPYHQFSSLSNMHASNEAEHQQKLIQLEQYTKLKANLIRGSPIFDGRSDFDVFVTSLHEYIQDLPYITESLRKSILKSACKGTAQEYLATIPALASQSFEAMLHFLHQRFGRDILSKKLAFDSLTQKPSETLYEFADRVQRAAIGTFRTNEEVVNRFIMGLKDKNLAEKLAILDFTTIPQVLAKAEKHINIRSNHSDYQPRKQSDYQPRKQYVDTKPKTKPEDAKASSSSFKSTSQASNKQPAAKSKPIFNKSKRANQVQLDNLDDADDDYPLNNMVEIFSLHPDEFTGTIDEVLAARADKPLHKYNLRSTGGLNKPQGNTSSSPSEQQQRDLIKQTLFPPAKASEDAEMAPQVTKAPIPSQPAPDAQVQDNLVPSSKLPMPARAQKSRVEKRSPPAPAFSPLYGEKPPIGDYLALLCGNNDFLTKVLNSELKRRYFELTTVGQQNSAPATAQAVSTNPPKRSPLQYQLVTLNHQDNVIGACADTGAEISLITTGALERAGISVDWDDLATGYPVKGISASHEPTKIIIVTLTFLHDEHPLSVRVALCVLHTSDYRFLIGRDILSKLNFQLTREGLTLTHPKSDVTALYSYAEAAAFTISSHPLVNTTELVLKGDNEPQIFKLSPECSNTKGDVDTPPQTILNFDVYAPITKGDGVSPPASSNSKGDVLPILNLPLLDKSYYSHPITQATQSYLGPELTKILQLEQFQVDNQQISAFSQWVDDEPIPEASVIAQSHPQQQIDPQSCPFVTLASLTLNPSLLPAKIIIPKSQAISTQKELITMNVNSTVLDIYVDNTQTQVTLLCTKGCAPYSEKIIPQLKTPTMSSVLILPEEVTITTAITIAEDTFHKLNSVQVQSTISEQPYELPNERFHTFESEAYELPTLQEATNFLQQANISFEQFNELHIRRGAYVLQRTREANPSAINSELSKEQQTALWQILFDFQDVAAFNFSDMPQPALVEPFVINTGDHAPISCRYYRLPPKIESHLREELETNTQLGLLQTSHSPWASPLFAVPKPGKSNVYQTVADYRPLNNITVPDRYPLPLVQQLFLEIGTSQYFHANDLLSGFWQIPCHTDSIPKTAVTTRWGLYEYTRTPQGVRNAPAHFMRSINKILTEAHLHDTNCAFVDDLTSHGDSFSSSADSLQSVLAALCHRRMYISPLKMKWGYQELALLGHLISHNQLKCQPKKLDAIMNLVPPADVSQLRSFLGIVGYYRTFISHFATVAAPLFNLLKKDTEYIWSPDCQKAFEALKISLQQDPVLNIPSSDQNAKYVLYTDWSVDAVSAILHQRIDNVEYVIEFSSKSCNKHEQRYCPTEGELLAIIYGLSKYRSYLLGQQFEIITDHSALQYLNTPRASPKIARWGLFLSEFTFTVIHRKGTAHTNADALSRLPAAADEQFKLDTLTCVLCEDDMTIYETTTQSSLECSYTLPGVIPQIYTMFQELLETSPCQICNKDEQGISPQVICDGCNGVYHLRCIQLNKVPHTYWYCIMCRAQYEQQSTYNILYDLDFQQYCLGSRKQTITAQEQRFIELQSQGFNYENGTLTKLINGKLYQVPSKGRQLLLLEEAHVRNGHVGSQRLFDLLSLEYWWPGMRQQCIQFVSQCLNCQLEKITYNRELDLQHLPQPSAARQHWHIDLAPDLPTHTGTKQLIICQDQFTKFVVLGCVERRTSASIAQWFLDKIISIFGVPTLIRSDQGNEFKGDFDDMCNSSCITHYCIAANSPWANGTAERLVRTVKSFMKRLAITEGEGNWPNWLPHLQLGYNLAKHESTKVQPFSAMFGGTGRFILEEPSVLIPFKSNVSKHSQQTKDFLSKIEKTILRNRSAALKRSAEQYGKQPVTDGLHKQKAKSLTPGQLVAISRQPRTHLGVSSLGPFIISKIEGTYVWVRSLTSGREKREHRVNVHPLALEIDRF